MFQQLDVFVNNTQITSASNHYGLTSYLQTLLNNRPEVQNEQHEMAMFYKDTYAQHDQFDHVLNTTSSIRRAYFANGTDVDMIGRPCSEIFNSNRYLLSNNDLKLVLHKAKDEFCLLTNKTEKYKMVITKAILHITKVKVAVGLSLAHQSLLAKG